MIRIQILNCTHIDLTESRVLVSYAEVKNLAEKKNTKSLSLHSEGFFMLKSFTILNYY